MYLETIYNEKYFIDVQPINSWEEWTYRIITEDLMAPMCVVYQSDPQIPFLTYNDAVNDAISKIDC